MIVINTKINVHDSKNLTKHIQGYLYSLLPEREHEGYEFRPGRNFKKTNFDYKLTKNNLTIRFSSIDPELEKAVAMGVIKKGVRLCNSVGQDVLLETPATNTSSGHVIVSGHVICSCRGLLDRKFYLEPQNPQHLEIMKRNALQRFETFMGKKYEDPFEVTLLDQSNNSRLYFYGDNKEPAKSWHAKWEIKASPELINIILGGGIGSGCMNYGAGFLELEEEK